jgi:signal transduction histidine kinase
LIERLIANLLANAVRHNVPGGRLRLATYGVAGRAAFTIANTGRWIPAGELDRLFRPFQRLDCHVGPLSEGVGLGLAIVQAIADAHEAVITARAPVGGGLEVDVDFPTQASRRPCRCGRCSRYRPPKD